MLDCDGDGAGLRLVVSYLTDGCDIVGVDIDGGEFRIKKKIKRVQETCSNHDLSFGLGIY